MKNQKTSKSTLARSEDGTVQLTLAIPTSKVDLANKEAFAELVKETEVPGFRKGKAPVDVARQHVSAQKLTERVLGKLLPDAYADALEEHKIRPILAPRFELLNVAEGKDWQIRAITCEFPRLELGDYKKSISTRVRAKDIWVPGETTPSAGSGQAKERPREEKEQEVLASLLETVQVQIPRLLIEEEVNHRLARLVEQTQALGLTVEKYLASIGKTAEQIRAQYAKDAETSIKIELILNSIAEKEGISVSELEIDEVIKTAPDSQTQERLKTPPQRLLIKGVLARRKALDELVALL